MNDSIQRRTAEKNSVTDEIDFDGWIREEMLALAWAAGLSIGWGEYDDLPENSRRLDSAAELTVPPESIKGN